MLCSKNIQHHIQTQLRTMATIPNIKYVNLIREDIRKGELKMTNFVYYLNKEELNELITFNRTFYESKINKVNAELFRKRLLYGGASLSSFTIGILFTIPPAVYMGMIMETGSWQIDNVIACEATFGIGVIGMGLCGISGLLFRETIFCKPDVSLKHIMDTYQLYFQDAQNKLSESERV